MLFNIMKTWQFLMLTAILGGSSMASAPAAGSAPVDIRLDSDVTNTQQSRDTTGTVPCLSEQQRFFFQELIDRFLALEGSCLPDWPWPSGLTSRDRQQFRQRVLEYLSWSDWLENRIGQPLAGAALQSGLDEVWHRAPDKNHLRRLFSLLQNDPRIIAECLVRPILTYATVRRELARPVPESVPAGILDSPPDKNDWHITFPDYVYTLPTEDQSWLPADEPESDEENEAFSPDTAEAFQPIVLDCPKLVARWGYGPTQAVFVSNLIAYIGSGSVLLVVDLVDPDNPVLLGELTLSGLIRDIMVTGNYAYIAADKAGLRIVNIADPSHLAETGFHDTPGFASGIAITGNYACLADDYTGLRIINISNPAAPAAVTSVDTPGSALDIAISGNYVYVADAGAGIRVFNISNPGAPVFLTVLDTPGQAARICINNQNAFVADMSGGVRIIDISNPVSPVARGACTTITGVVDVAVSGNYVYAANSADGLAIIGVSDPANPVLLGSVSLDAEVLAITAAGGLLYAGASQQGVQVLDISTPSSPQPLGGYLTHGPAANVWLAGQLAFIAESGNGFRIVDFTRPAVPVSVGFGKTTGSAHDVTVSGDFAYVADGDQGLRIFDVSDPVNPVLINTYDTPGHAWSVKVSGGYAYVADGNAGLRIISIADPTIPGETGFFNTPGTAVGVWISGGYAYIADFDEGLRIVDISNPSQPFQAGFFNTAGNTQGVTVSGSYAYLGDMWNGFQIINVSNPATPWLVSSASPPGDIRGVTVHGPYAYLANDSSGLRVIDLADAAHPAEAGSASSPGNVLAVSYFAGRVFAADGQTGVAVFNLCANENLAPLAPTNLSGVILGQSQVRLDWWDNSLNETGFKIERHTEGTSTWSQIAATASDVTSYQDVSLAPDATYHYRLRAYNAHGNSTYTNEITLRPPSPPAAPTNLTAVVATNTQINLTWQDNSGSELEFQLERKTGTGIFTLLVTLAANSTAYHDTGLPAGTTFTYRIRTRNESGYSAYSNESSATTPGGLPLAPANLQAAAVSSSQINLTWLDQSANETGFKIDRRTGTSGNWNQIALIQANSTSYQDTGLSASTSYYYRVKATNSTGDSINSNEAWATTSGGTKPNPPTNLKAFHKSKTSLVISWQDNSNNESGFRIERRMASSQIWGQKATTGPDVSVFEDTGLPEETTYYYRIKAYNAAGESRYSNIASANTGEYDCYLLAAARTAGVGNSYWRSDIDMLNLVNYSAVVQIALLLQNQANLTPSTVNITIPPGKSMKLSDILGTTFKAGNAALGFRILNGDVLVNSRFYNTALNSGTYGMSIPSVTERQALVGDGVSTAIFHHLMHHPAINQGFRTNLGFLNTSAFNVQVRLTLIGDQGETLGIRTISLRPFEQQQFTKIHSSFGLTNVIEHGSCSISVLTESGKVQCYAMVIDNASNGPVYYQPDLLPR